MTRAPRAVISVLEESRVYYTLWRAEKNEEFDPNPDPLVIRSQVS
jgi:hypothetical protein